MYVYIYICILNSSNARFHISLLAKDKSVKVAFSLVRHECIRRTENFKI